MPDGYVRWVQSAPRSSLRVRANSATVSDAVRYPSVTTTKPLQRLLREAESGYGVRRLAEQRRLQPSPAYEQTPSEPFVSAPPIAETRESSPPEGSPLAFPDEALERAESTVRAASRSQIIPKASGELDTRALNEALGSESAPPRVTSQSAFAGVPAPECSAATEHQPLGVVVGVLAHDLNNLLQIISTTTQLLSLREQNKDSLLFLADIASATARAAQLTSGLLDAARAERRRGQPSERPSNIAALTPPSDAKR